MNFEERTNTMMEIIVKEVVTSGMYEVILNGMPLAQRFGNFTWTREDLADYDLLPPEGTPKDAGFVYYPDTGAVLRRQNGEWVSLTSATKPVFSDAQVAFEARGTDYAIYLKEIGDKNEQE